MKSKINKTLEQINASLINLVICCIGFICLLSALFTDHQDGRNILLSIGCSLIASSVVSYLTSKYLVRMNRIKHIVEHWGLAAIFETRQEMNRSTDIAFESLEKNLDIIAWGLKSFRDAKDKIVREKVKRGLKIRFVTLHPDSEYIKQRENDEKEVPGQIRNTILNLQEWIDDLRTIAPNPDNIQVKYYNSLPEDFYFRVDDHIFIGPYLYGISSQQTISYEFQAPAKGASYYKEYFERLWNDSKFCKKLEQG
ncbi:MAG: hypothetical protein RBR08_08270 [Desulforegulaceae bacterium]|nr:hypothetical protein [Desulforegulaceae bacterium]